MCVHAFCTARASDATGTKSGQCACTYTCARACLCTEYTHGDPYDHTTTLRSRKGSLEKGPTTQGPRTPPAGPRGSGQAPTHATTENGRAQGPWPPRSGCPTAAPAVADATGGVPRQVGHQHPKTTERGGRVKLWWCSPGTPTAGLCHAAGLTASADSAHPENTCGRAPSYGRACPCHRLCRGLSSACPSGSGRHTHPSTAGQTS